MPVLEINSAHWNEWLEYWQTKQSRDLYAGVVNYLRDGHELRISEGTRLVQILRLPSFDPWVSYEIFRGYSGPVTQRTAQYLLLKTSWNLPDDFARWKVSRPDQLSPSFSYAQAALDEQFVVTVNDAFRTNVPAWFEMNEAKIGNDGETYEVAFGDYFLSVRYRWWEAPTEWQPLHKSLLENVAKFEQILKQET